MAVVLNSWKEIARYLDAGVRTVQRWEHKYGLPVYHTGMSRTPVLAYPSELNAWLHSRRDSVTNLAHFRNENTREVLTRLRVLLAQMRELMRAQTSLTAELSSTYRALNSAHPLPKQLVSRHKGRVIAMRAPRQT